MAYQSTTEEQPPSNGDGPDWPCRQYLRITPTDTSLTPETIQTQFRRLHELAWETADRAGWRGRVTRRLFGSPRRPRTLEWLLVTDGESGQPLQYYVGIEAPATRRDSGSAVDSESDHDGRHNEWDHDAVRRVLRTVLPNDYEVEYVRWHPRDVLGTGHVETASVEADAADGTPDGTPDDDSVGDSEVEHASDGGADSNSITEGDGDDTNTGTVESIDAPPRHGANADDRPPEPSRCEAVEFVGETTHRKDWQTRLTPLDAWLGPDVDARPPLTELVEAMAESAVPMVYQVLLRPLSSWGGAAADRRHDLLEGRDSLAARVARDIGLGSDDLGKKRRTALERRRTDGDDPLGRGQSAAATASAVERVRAIEVRDPEHSFVVNARLVARGHPERMDTRCEHLTGVFGTADGPYHRIRGIHTTGGAAKQVCDALCERRHASPAYDSHSAAIPGLTATSRGIVADAREAPTFCVLDGGSLTPTAMRGLAPTPGERSQPRGPPPARDRLARYRGPGLTLGEFDPGWTTGVDSMGLGVHETVREHDRGQPESVRIRLPPALQQLHIAWFGKTGSGKTTAATTGLIDNHVATEGATVVIDQKGDGMADELSRIQYAYEETLEEIVYFDCTQTLPAISFFDIRDQLDAGIPRDVAVADVAAHYAEILAQLHSDYYAAGMSVKVIEAVVKALFDPVHGADAFTHRELREMLSWMTEHQSAPAVSDPQLDRVLTDAVTGPRREFMNIMTGVTNRVDEITLQTQLETALNHVHPTPSHETDADAAATQSPQFDFVDMLDENVIIVFDMGGLRERAQRAMTLLIVSSLWTALRRRVHRRQRLYGQRSLEATDANEVGAERSHNRVGDPRAKSHDVEAHTAATGSGGLEKDTETETDTVTGKRATSDETAERGETETEAVAGTDAVAGGVTNIGAGADVDAVTDAGADGAAGVATDAMAVGDESTRTARTERESGVDGLSLVNLHVEEAARVAVSGVFSDLLAQARSFGCSVTLSMQYPAQLKQTNPEAYAEVLNNVSTVVTGNVPLDRDLAARLATEDMAPQEVANRLRALSRGEWLCSLPAGFGEVEPRPFVLRSVPLPPGHPEGTMPLSAAEELHFEIAQVRRETRIRRRYGLSIDRPSTVSRGDGAEADATADEEDAASEEDDDMRRPRVDSTLPYTLRLPKTVGYAEEVHGLVCTACENRYDPTAAGIERAIACCSSLEAVDPDDVPVCEVNLKLARSEREETGLSDTQLMLLQVVYNAQQLRYEPPAYDILFDSMIRLIEYVGADKDDVQALIDAEYLTHDTDHPHRLYSVTPAGRDCLGEAFREGVDYGHGRGDLEETSAHVLMVEAARRYLLQEYVEDPDSPVTRVVPYYEVDGHRLDLAGLDAAGDVVVAVEAERVNHDLRRAAPSDFDKMAACEPAEAIWVVLTTAAAHDVIDALYDPLDDEPRLESTYSRTTMPNEFTLDEPGITDVYPVKQLLTQLDRR